MSSKVVPLNGFGGSGNSNLFNFEIKNYLSLEELQLDTPKENTLGIVSDLAVTNFGFGYHNPYIIIPETTSAMSVSGEYSYFNMGIDLNFMPDINKKYIIKINDTTHNIKINDLNAITVSEDDYVEISILDNVIYVRIADINLGSSCTITMYLENLKDGSVWFSIGETSAISTDIIKKNCCRLSIISANQFVNNTWESKEMFGFQNNTWIDQYIWLFKDGIFFDTYGSLINGGNYTYYSTGGHNRCSFSTKIENEQLKCSWARTSSSSGYDSSYAYFSTPIDFTNINTVEISVGAKDDSSISMIVLSALGDDVSQYEVASGDTPAGGTGVMDVSNLTGKYYLGFSMYKKTSASAHYFYIKSLVLK